MDNKELHHKWRKTRPIKSWFFLIISVFSLGLGVYAMRQNNLTALRLREVVAKADKANKNVEKPLRELREYIYSHMNADLSAGGSVQQPVQLKYRYDRLVAAEKAKASKSSSQVYTEAQAVCEKKFPAGLSGRGRIPCIKDYVNKHKSKEAINIPDALYKFNFVSPRWSPDVAGIALLVSAIFFVLFLGWFVMERWVKHRLKQHE